MVSARHGIAVSHEGPDVAVLALTGEHDQYTSRAVSETIAEALAAGRSVVVDLRQTAFLDSTSAGALLVADQRATAAGLRLVIVLTDETPLPVVRLFETARLGQILTVAPAFETALELARSPLQSEA